LVFFFFQAEDGIRDWRDWSSDVCSSDLITYVFHKLKMNKNKNILTRQPCDSDIVI